MTMVNKMKQAVVEVCGFDPECFEVAVTWRGPGRLPDRLRIAVMRGELLLFLTDLPALDSGQTFTASPGQITLP